MYICIHAYKYTFIHMCVQIEIEIYQIFVEKQQVTKWIMEFSAVI